MKAIGIIAAIILIFFGVLFIWGAFSPEGSIGWIFIGLITVGIGFVIIFFATRKKAVTTAPNITYKLDLPGQVSMETIKCQSCGGVLAKDDIKIVNGAPLVSCPYCGTSYQMTEEPKW